MTQKIGMVENYSVRLRGEKRLLVRGIGRSSKIFIFILGMLYKDRPNFSPQEVLHKASRIMFWRESNFFYDPIFVTKIPSQPLTSPKSICAGGLIQISLFFYAITASLYTLRDFILIVVNVFDYIMFCFHFFWEFRTLNLELILK